MCKRSTIIGSILLPITLFSLISCKKLPYVPGDGAVIYMEAIPASLSAGDTARVVLRGEKESGYPLPDGTLVYLNATRGSIDAQVVLENGHAEAVYQSEDGYLGEVLVSAHCGGAETVPEQLVITIVDQDISFLYINAQPAVLPHEGGTSLITARALDENMVPVPGKTLFLKTSAGTLQHQSGLETDQEGRVETRLTTDRAAVVTVSYKELEESVEVTTEPANLPPEASFVYSPTEPGSGERVFFNAQQSSDSDGTIVSFQWDFGDGKTGSGETVSHAYHVSKTTTFVVTLKVLDNDGAPGVASQQITIRI